MKIFDPQKEITLITVSERTVSAILSKEDHPIMYFSRKLIKAEVDYSNIEKEALAIVWSTERAWQFLLDRKIFVKI